MLLTLILLGLIVGIAVRQASQGAFAALVMTGFTCCAASVAIGTYEWVAIHWLAPFWKPDFALPVALGATFAVPLGVLRLAFDLLVKRSCLLPGLIDRIGGGVCGMITAMTMVGILGVCLQMLPFDNGLILGFERVPSAETATSKESPQNELIPVLKPDRFAVALASAISSGVFSTEHDIDAQGPDLVEVIGWVGAAEPSVSRFAPPGSISVVSTKPLDAVFKMTPASIRGDKPEQYEALPPSAGHEFRAVLVKLRDQARDKHRSHIFTLRQFRLVGKQAGRLSQYHPVAIRLQDEDAGTERYIRSVQQGKTNNPVVDNAYSPIDKNAEVGIVFEIPSGFEPGFLEYKREARATLSFDDSESPDAKADETPSETPSLAAAPVAPNQDGVTPSTGRRSGRRSGRSRSSTASSSSRRRGGNVRNVASTPGGSRFSNEMPMTLTSYQRRRNAELKRGALVSGHLLGEVSAQSDGTDTPISKFEVPDDKRLLQLSSVQLQARSGLGKIVTQVIATVQNYFVEDDRGRQYKIVGKYAIADARGTQVVEVQYYSDAVGAIGGLGKFNRIDQKKMGPNDTLVMLFLVDPGARIVMFSTGGAATRSEDLSSENLVAPK